MVFLLLCRYSCLQLTHKSVKNQILSLPEHDRSKQQLVVAIKNAGEKLKKFCLYEQMHHNSGSNEKENKDSANENIDEVTNQINQQIEYAAALDLVRRPRLSRTNAGKCFN